MTRPLHIEIARNNRQVRMRRRLRAVDLHLSTLAVIGAGFFAATMIVIALTEGLRAWP